MDCDKIGKLICRLRKEKGYTQRQLAERMNISDKAVSKWERGMGCPDLSLICELAAHLGVDSETLLSGQLEENGPVGGNMKKLRFYICPQCGNVIAALAEASVSCCGKKLEPAEPRKAEEGERLTVENIEDEYFISSGHEMTKEHYISFVALLTGDGMVMKKLYPEWNMQARIPRIGHGMLTWYCNKCGLLYQLI